MSQIEVRQITESRGTICNDLLRSLPLWFGIESAIQQYASDVETMPTFAAYVDNKPVGLISLNRHNEWTAEIHVIAVRAEFHRNGIGRKLVEASENYLKALRYDFFFVKTLSPSKSNKEYEITRKFYYSQGFRAVEEFKILWGEANPCLLMIKSL